MQRLRPLNAEWHAIYPTGSGAGTSRNDDRELSPAAAPIPALKNSEIHTHAERGGVMLGKKLRSHSLSRCGARVLKVIAVGGANHRNQAEGGIYG